MKNQRDCIMRGMEPTSITDIQCDYDGCDSEPVHDVEWVLNKHKTVKKSLCREHTDLAIEESKITFERSERQMTLGELTRRLETLPENTFVANLQRPHSYRGFYSDIAFEHQGGTRPITDLIDDCKYAMGNTFIGYKGGDFLMGAATPVWVAVYGSCGDKLVGVNDDGDIETEEYSP